jgi:hypothetical protein
MITSRMEFVTCGTKFRLDKIAICVLENREIEGTGIIILGGTSVDRRSVGSISPLLTRTCILTIVGEGGITIVRSFNDLARYLVNLFTLVQNRTRTSDIHTLTLGVASPRHDYTITTFEGRTLQIRVQFVTAFLIQSVLWMKVNMGLSGELVRFYKRANVLFHKTMWKFE